MELNGTPASKRRSRQTVPVEAHIQKPDPSDVNVLCSAINILERQKGVYTDWKRMHDDWQKAEKDLALAHSNCKTLQNAYNALNQRMRVAEEFTTESTDKLQRSKEELEKAQGRIQELDEVGRLMAEDLAECCKTIDTLKSQLINKTPESEQWLHWTCCTRPVNGYFV